VAYFKDVQLLLLLLLLWMFPITSEGRSDSSYMKGKRRASAVLARPVLYGRGATFLRLSVPDDPMHGTDKAGRKSPLSIKEQEYKCHFRTSNYSPSIRFFS
jgi:hypothetical protein